MIDPCQIKLHDRGARRPYNRTDVTNRSQHPCLKGGATESAPFICMASLYLPGNGGGESLAHNADVCKIKTLLAPLCSILRLISYTHFSAISAPLPCCCLVSTFPPPQHLPSSLISSSPKHRLQLLELFTPFPLFSLLQLLLSSPGYFPYLCVINIKKQERLPLPPAPHCESLQPASDSPPLAVTSRQM